MREDPSVPTVSRFYTRIARLYDMFAASPIFAGLRAEAAKALDIGPGARVLEVGCGTGGNLPHLGPMLGPEGAYVGLDASQGMLAQARTRTVEPSVHLLQGDATSPPISGTFDGILVTFVSGVLGDPAAAVNQWLSLLGDEGRLVLLDAAGRRGVATPLEWGFRTFTYLAAPPSARAQYESSPNEVLIERVEAARNTLRTQGEPLMETDRWRGFVRLTVAGPP